MQLIKLKGSLMEFGSIPRIIVTLMQLRRSKNVIEVLSAGQLFEVVTRKFILSSS